MADIRTVKIVGIQIYGASGLPSGEGMITVRDQETASTKVVRLGGPGTNDAGTVTNEQFEARAKRLIEVYCQQTPISISYKEIGLPLPDITSVDGV